MAKSVSILFGTQSGNSEDLAHSAAKIAAEHGLDAKVLGMDECTMESLSNTERILIICSTWGEGDMPENAEELWESASSDDAPRMENTYFSVLSLGDSSYTFFCQSGIDWDERLEQLGAKRIANRVDCDLDFDDDFKKWIDVAMPAIANVGGESEAVQESDETDSAVQEVAAAEISTAVSGNSEELDALMQGERDLLILFGSQSGNSEGLAHDTAKKAAIFGLNPRVVDMEDYSIEELAGVKRLLIICSTWGEGDMPDNAEVLWQQAQASSTKLSVTNFSVLALGDTSYEFFCQSGIDWDQRLEQLGANRLSDRVDCDVEFDDAFTSWVEKVLPRIAAVNEEGVFQEELVESLLSLTVESDKSTSGDSILADLSGNQLSANIRIFRYNPVKATTGWDTYDCSMMSNASIYSLLDEIKSTQDGSLSFRSEGPLSGVLVNGKVVLAQDAILGDFSGNNGEVSITIEPLPGFEVVKDLIVSTTSYDNHRNSVAPWMSAATRPANKTNQGVTIGSLTIGEANRLHTMYDLNSPILVHSSSNTVPFNSNYIGPALVHHLWTRINDPRSSSSSIENMLKVLQDDGGSWSETDTSSVSRYGGDCNLAAESIIDSRGKLLSANKFAGRSGRHIKWFARSVKWSGNVNETTLYRQVLGPIGLLSNAFKGVSARMILGFTRTGGPVLRGLQGMVTAPAGIGKMPKMFNTRVHNHHEVAAIFNELDNRF